MRPLCSLLLAAAISLGAATVAGAQVTGSDPTGSTAMRPVSVSNEPQGGAVIQPLMTGYLVDFWSVLDRLSSLRSLRVSTPAQSPAVFDRPGRAALAVHRRAVR